jgi:hypothetical protein
MPGYCAGQFDGFPVTLAMGVSLYKLVSRNEVRHGVIAGGCSPSYSVNRLQRFHEQETGEQP